MRREVTSGLRGVVLAAVAAASVAAAATAATQFTSWGLPVNVESIPGTSSELNTPFNDGCPIQSPDGLSLYIASNRTGGLGGQDIWVAHRESRNAPFGAPENLGAPVNSAADDFCPTPLRGKRLLFVSAREGPGSCGGPDIYSTRRNPMHGWQQPENLGCQVNSAGGEAGPSLVETSQGAILYFSSTRAGGYSADPQGSTPDSDIYASEQLADGRFGQAELVPGLNTASDDSRPNVRKDGLEVVFDSSRPAPSTTPPPADLYSATRAGTDEEWSVPTSLGVVVNTTFNESRASFSWDGETLYFGSNRPGGEGSADVYATTREKLRGGR